MASDLRSNNLLDTIAIKTDGTLWSWGGEVVFTFLAHGIA